MQFSAAVTYNMFVTLGLITAVPVSGGTYKNLSNQPFAGPTITTIIAKTMLKGFRDHILF